jgi:hypothetical protein
MCQVKDMTLPTSLNTSLSLKTRVNSWVSSKNYRQEAEKHRAELLS